TCRCFDAAAPDTSTLTSCDPEASTCGGSESCQCFYGPPLPLSSGGVPVCVVNKFDGPFAGTVNIADTGPDAGGGAAGVRRLSSVYNGLGATKPCPQCEADITARDGVAQGTCSGGARDGMPCDSAGLNVYFGAVSIDCPPSSAANIGDLTVHF